VPGEWIDAILVHSENMDTLDVGLKLRFDDGLVDEFGAFFIGCEDFEGFHVWRGIEPDGSDLECIGEMSKEEAIIGTYTGGSEVDSFYFDEIIPALRDNGVYFFPFSVPCLGNRIDLELEDNQYMWFDCNVYNGFTYYYLITTFDRGYNIEAGTQGLQKSESCLPVLGDPYECRDDLLAVSIKVDPQNDLLKVYAVPNPYRSGGSAFATQNYHNFKYGKIRFVNVPAVCYLKIYTVSGDLIWETVHREETSGNIEWDVRNEAGEEVTSGIYIYKLENEKGNYIYGRLVIIR
jgi:hypothetical protein